MLGHQHAAHKWGGAAAENGDAQGVGGTHAGGGSLNNRLTEGGSFQQQVGSRGVPGEQGGWGPQGESEGLYMACVVFHPIGLTAAENVEVRQLASCCGALRSSALVPRVTHILVSVCAEVVLILRGAFGSILHHARPGV